MSRPEQQANTRLEPGADPRLYEVGRLLVFEEYDEIEVDYVEVSTFHAGDALRVVRRNGCGMGIDVERVSDGKTDMVWPNEVKLAEDGRQC